MQNEDEGVWTHTHSKYKTLNPHTPTFIHSPPTPPHLVTSITIMSSTQVEGLLPFIYKAIKDRRRTSSRTAYRTAEAEAEEEDDDVVDLGDSDQRRRWLEQELRSPIRATGPSSSDEGHGRNRSLEELAGQVGGTPDRRLRVPLPKARSVRVFSCIGAGAA